MVKNYHQITSNITANYAFSCDITVCEIWGQVMQHWFISTFYWNTTLKHLTPGAVVIVRQTFNENDRYSHKHKHTNHQSRQAAFKLMPICLLHTRDLLNLQEWKKKHPGRKDPAGVKINPQIRVSRKQKVQVGKKFSSTKFNSI